MVTIYVLQSLKDFSRYTGMTTNLEVRLMQHNSGKSKYTKGHMPWKVVYTEEREDWNEARIREKFLKSSDGLTYLKNQGLFS